MIFNQNKIIQYVIRKRNAIFNHNNTVFNQLRFVFIFYLFIYSQHFLVYRDVTNLSFLHVVHIR